MRRIAARLVPVAAAISTAILAGGLKGW